jgi:hypothetical protein
MRLHRRRRSTDEKAPEFDPAQSAQSRIYLVNTAGASKIDNHTVAFETKVPDSLFPYEISYVMMISPCRAKELKYNWGAICIAPFRHRPLPLRPHGAASAHGAGAQYRLLG